MNAPRLVIFARAPEPGKVKTRLIPALGDVGAARIYERLLDHTMAEAQTSGLDCELRVTGDDRRWFLDRQAGRFTMTDQGVGDLGERLARVPTPALIIGSDCPGLTATILRDAAAALNEHTAVLGPATDGGYYLIGLREPMPFLFDDMAWSTSTVLADTLERLTARGIAPAILPELADIDTPEDLAAWPDLP